MIRVSTIGSVIIIIYSVHGSFAGECGNSMMEQDELCDDGNTDDGDGCSFTCTVEGFEKYGGSMIENYVLNKYEVLRSPSGCARLVMQNDGNLVIYTEEPQLQSLWHSGTVGAAAAFAVLQGDGNFVVYNGGYSPVWAASVYPVPNPILHLNDNGNLIISDSVTGVIYWQTNTARAPSMSLCNATTDCWNGQWGEWDPCECSSSTVSRSRHCYFKPHETEFQATKTMCSEECPGDCFYDPTHPFFDDHFVDGCYFWSQECSSGVNGGSSAAPDAYCASKGYGKSVYYSVVPGAPTKTMGSHRTCAAATCGHFSTICCSGVASCVLNDSCVDCSSSTCSDPIVSYQGSRNTTIYGKTCQAWGATMPHVSSYGTNYWEHNYCRNSDNTLLPWCYTMDPEVEWEYCFSPCNIWSEWGTCRRTSTCSLTGVRSRQETTKQCSSTVIQEECNGVGCTMQGHGKLDTLEVFCQLVHGTVIGSSCFKVLKSNTAQTSWNDQWQMCKDLPTLAYSKQFKSRVCHIYSGDILEALGEYLLSTAEFSGYVAIGAKKISPLGAIEETFHWMRDSETHFEKSFSAYNSKIASPDGIVVSNQTHFCVLLNRMTSKEWELNTGDCNDLGPNVLCEFVASVQRYNKHVPEVKHVGSALKSRLQSLEVSNIWECGLVCTRMDGCVGFKYNNGFCRAWSLKASDNTHQGTIYYRNSDSDPTFYDRYF